MNSGTIPACEDCRGITLPGDGILCGVATSSDLYGVTTSSDLKGIIGTGDD